MDLRENVSLAQYTTLGVGGAARYFYAVRSEDDVKQALTWARERSLPMFILGGGSNLVISDAGFQGLVIQVAIDGIEARPDANNVLFICGAGVEWDAVVERSVNGSCSGLECLSGIPGSVGGTPVQNVGAYGQEVSETLISVRAIDVETGAVRDFSKADCQFDYRTSRFNTVDRGRYIITQVAFTLSSGGVPRIEYADLKNRFLGETGTSLQDVRDAVLSIRKSKSMFFDQNDPNSHSAGSFFKNPIVSAAQCERIKSIATSRGLTLKTYPLADGQVKVPAAWLIEQSGLHKGFSLGPVGISAKHTLALVNLGGATASDVLAMKSLVQAKVRDTFEVELQPEPVFVGFEEEVTGVHGTVSATGATKLK